MVKNANEYVKDHMVWTAEKDMNTSLVIDRRNIYNLNSCEIKAWKKKFSLERDSTATPVECPRSWVRIPFKPELFAVFSLFMSSYVFLRREFKKYALSYVYLHAY